MHSLTVLYDPHCAFCVRCAAWLAGQSQYLPLELTPLDSPRARALAPALPDAAKAGELTAIDDEGGVYTGNQAYLICLYALRDYREWSARLLNPALWPLARRAMDWVTDNRANLSRFFKEAQVHG
jgi:predicted DCC family thiol-disulfide oxidoreductase YuxK